MSERADKPCDTCAAWDLKSCHFSQFSASTESRWYWICRVFEMSCFVKTGFGGGIVGGRLVDRGFLDEGVEVWLLKVCSKNMVFAICTGFGVISRVFSIFGVFIFLSVKLWTENGPES